MIKPRELDDSNSSVLGDPIRLGDGSFLELREGRSPHPMPTVYKNGVETHEISVRGSNICLFSMDNLSSPADNRFLIISVHAFLGELFKNLSKEDIEAVVPKWQTNLHSKIYHLKNKDREKLVELFSTYGVHVTAAAMFSFCRNDQFGSAAYTKSLISYCSLVQSTVVDTAEMANKFIDVYFMRAGLENYSFLKKFDRVSGIDLANKSVREFFCKAYSALIHTGMEEKVLRDTKVVNMETVEVDNAVIRTLDLLPVSIKLYREYLLGVTADDCRYLSGKLTMSTPGAAGVYVSERLLKNRVNDLEKNLSFRKTLDDLTSLISKKIVHKGVANVTNRWIRERATVECVEVLSEIVHGLTDVESENLNEISKSARFFMVPEEIQKWVTFPSDADLVVGMLREKMSAMSVYDAISTVRDEKKPFTLTQWIKVAEEYDEMFRDVPCSWWSSMV